MKSRFLKYRGAVTGETSIYRSAISSGWVNQVWLYIKGTNQGWRSGDPITYVNGEIRHEGKIVGMTTGSTYTNGVPSPIHVVIMSHPNPAEIGNRVGGTIATTAKETDVVAPDSGTVPLQPISQASMIGKLSGKTLAFGGIAILGLFLLSKYSKKTES